MRLLPASLRDYLQISAWIMLGVPLVFLFLLAPFYVDPDMVDIIAGVGCGAAMIIPLSLLTLVWLRQASPSRGLNQLLRYGSLGAAGLGAIVFLIGFSIFIRYPATTAAQLQGLIPACAAIPLLLHGLLSFVFFKQLST